MRRRILILILGIWIFMLILAFHNFRCMLYLFLKITKKSIARVGWKHYGIISCFVDFNFLTNIKSSEFISTFMVQIDVKNIFFFGKYFYAKTSSCLDFVFLCWKISEKMQSKKEDKGRNQSKPKLAKFKNW